MDPQKMKRISDMLVVVGPSGSGKSTLITRLMKEFPTCFGYSVSHTTRPPRTGEVNGTSYHFVDDSTFKALVDQGAFVEHAMVHDTHYGTSFGSVNSVHDQNRVCVMDLDIVGATNLKKQPNLRTVVVFVEPPSMEELEKRLRGRGTETEERIQKRLRNAIDELQWFRDHPKFFDGALLNDDVDACYSKFRECVMSKCFTKPDAHAR